MVGDGDLLLIGAARRRRSPRAGARSRPARGTARPPRRWPTSAIAEGTAPFALLSQFAGGPARARALRRRRADPDRRPHGARVFRRRAASTAERATTTPRRSARSAREPPAAVREAVRPRDRRRLGVARSDGAEGPGVSRGLRRVSAGRDAQQPERRRRSAGCRTQPAAPAGSTKSANGCSAVAAREPHQCGRSHRAVARPRRDRRRRRRVQTPRPTRCGWRPTTRARPSSWPRSSPTPATPSGSAPLADAMVARFPDRLEAALLPRDRAVPARTASRTRWRPPAGGRAGSRTTRARRACSARRAPRRPARMRAGGVRSAPCARTRAIRRLRERRRAQPAVGEPGGGRAVTSPAR